MKTLARLLMVYSTLLFQVGIIQAQIDAPGDGNGSGVGVQICDHTAVVVQGVECPLLQILSTSQLYEICGSSVPYSNPLVLGDTVRYTFTTAPCAPYASFCQQGTLIYLTCFAVVGSQNCPQPPSNVTATPNPVCTGDTLVLSATGSSLSWTGPDGFTATGSSVSRIITSTSQAGVYYVTQTANNCTSAAASISVTVNQTPDPPSNVTATPNPICTGETLSLSAIGSNLSWSGPDEFTASGSPVSRLITNVNQAGTYNVTQTVNNCTSDAASISVSVTHTPAPTNVTATPNPICTQQTLTLTATGSGLSWTGPANFSASGSPVTRFISDTAQGGLYYVTQTANGCTSESASVFVTVNQTPDAPSQITAAPNPVCAGSTLFLSTGLTVGPVIKYYGPNFWMAYGNPGASRFITDTTNAGIYSVTQTVNGCESERTSVDVKVQIPPYIGGWIQSQPTSCGGSDGVIGIGGLKPNQFYGVRFRKDGGPLTHWGGFSSSSGGGLMLDFLSKGYYTDIQVGDTVCQSNILDGPFVLVDPTPPAAPTALLAEPNPVNTGGTLTLSATGVNLNWIGPDDFFESGSPVLRSISSKAQEGMYYVTQTVTNCTSPAASIFVSVQGGALPILLDQFTARCSDEGVELNWNSKLEFNNAYFSIYRSSDMVEWTEVSHVEGAGNSSSERFYRATDRKPLNGQAYYRLIQTDYDGSQMSFDAVAVRCEENVHGEIDIQIFPNPADAQFTLHIESDCKESTDAAIRITDISGRMLSSREINLPAGSSRHLFEGSELVPGTYLLNIISEGWQSKPVKLMIK